MNLLPFLAWNQLVVIPLAGTVWLLSKVRFFDERPALRHGLWLLVLLKLVAPPLFVLPILPAAADRASQRPEVRAANVDAWTNPSTAADERAALRTGVKEFARVPGDAGLSSPFRPATGALLAISLLVSACFWFTAIRHAWRIRRILGKPVGVPGRAVDALRDSCKYFGLKTEPTLLVVDEPVSPMLWAGLGDATIVFPQTLTATIGDHQLQHILAHELAHLVRRDHWVNVLVFFVTSVFWWNPIAWLARRELRTAAESCCDAMAIARLAGSRKSYAKTLLDAVDFVACHKPLPTSAAATFGESHSLKRRIEMIANPNVKSSLSRSGVLLVACGVVSLTLLPARAEQEIPRKAASEGAAQRDSGRSQRTKKGATSEKPNAQATNPHPTAHESFWLDWPKFQDRQLGPIRWDFATTKTGIYTLPDYLPAAHDNVVNSLRGHHFMLQPIGSPREWYIICFRDAANGTGQIRILWDAKLTIPAGDKIKQGDAFVLHTAQNMIVVAFVEDDYTNDRDIGVKIIDVKSGQIKHQCTLLRHMGRYQRMADSMSTSNAEEVDQPAKAGKEDADNPADGLGASKDSLPDSETKKGTRRVAPSGSASGTRVSVPLLGPAPIALDFAFPVDDRNSHGRQNFGFFFGIDR